MVQSLLWFQPFFYQVHFHPRWRGDHSVPAQRVQLDWTIAGSISKSVGRHILSYRSSAAE